VDVHPYSCVVKASNCLVSTSGRDFSLRSGKVWSGKRLTKRKGKNETRLVRDRETHIAGLHLTYALDLDGLGGDKSIFVTSMWGLSRKIFLLLTMLNAWISRGEIDIFTSCQLPVELSIYPRLTYSRDTTFINPRSVKQRFERSTSQATHRSVLCHVPRRLVSFTF
jgi:hypothetical protein